MIITQKKFRCTAWLSNPRQRIIFPLKNNNNNKTINQIRITGTFQVIICSDFLILPLYWKSTWIFDVDSYTALLNLAKFIVRLDAFKSLFWAKWCCRFRRFFENRKQHFSSSRTNTTSFWRKTTVHVKTISIIFEAEFYGEKISQLPGFLSLPITEIHWNLLSPIWSLN